MESKSSSECKACRPKHYETRGMCCSGPSRVTNSRANGSLKGIPTKKHYKCTTVFVDLYSNLGYVYLQQLTAADEMIKAKKEAFKIYAKSYSVSI